jgi:lectin, mannose-binding 2
MTFTQLSLLISFAVLYTSVTSISRLEDQSFQAPFENYNSAGQRIIASYREGGHAKVFQNFIRLTPDRQSKRGHVWSSRRVDTNDWSVVLQFRVSGQGKTLFGDGLAFWFTDMPNIQPGEVFGVKDDFKGFAVIFDTFKNQEYANVHKDISVLTGDGKPGAGDRRNTERAGCDSDFRYYEGADSFDVSKSLSFAKISLKGRTLKVSIDPLATGNFKVCFESTNVLPADFDISTGFFGLTATTGGLADNHDVLAMNAYKLESMDTEGPTPELHYSKKAPEVLPAHETVGDPNYDPESALRSLISSEKKVTNQQVNDVKHYGECHLL